MVGAGAVAAGFAGVEVGFEDQAIGGVVAGVFEAGAGVAGGGFFVGPVPGAFDGVPGVGEGLSGREIEGGGVVAGGVVDAGPAGAGAGDVVGFKAGDGAFDGVAAGEEGGGAPVGVFAVHDELVVLGVDAAAGFVEDEGVFDEGVGVFGEVVFGGDGPAALAVGHPGVKLEEGVEVMPAAVVFGFDGGVAVPAHVAVFQAGFDPEGGFDGVQAAAKAPAVAVDHLEGGDAAWLGGVGAVVFGEQAEVVDGDRLLVVSFAVAGDGFDDGFEGGAVGGAVGLDFDALDGVGAAEGGDEKEEEEGDREEGAEGHFGFLVVRV